MELRDAVYVDGVRLPIGRARDDGLYAAARADDMAVRTIRALLERTGVDPALIDDNVWAATAQVGDQGLTLGRSTAVLAGLPKSVPGYALDRMCAGALTAITNGANAIRVGAQRLVLAGGVEHMGHHPMGAEIDPPNPRFVAEGVVDPQALVMGVTAERLHDELPGITRERCDAYAVQSQERVAKARAEGVFDDHVVPMTVWSPEGWRVAAEDEHPRPGTTLEDLARLDAPFRPGGRVTAGNAAGLNDGAGCVLLADAEAAEELGLPARMRLVDYAFVGVEPETMGYGPVPATQRLLERTGLTIDDIDVVELNEAFAVQCLAFLDHFGLELEDDKVNPYGGAIALGHPLAMSGARLAQQLAHALHARPDARYGVTTLCIGLGMGCAVLWEKV